MGYSLAIVQPKVDHLCMVLENLPSVRNHLAVNSHILRILCRAGQELSDGSPEAHWVWCAVHHETRQRLGRAQRN